MQGKMKESQYKVCLDIKNKNGVTKLGLMSNQAWFDDPKHIVFVLARYKFVAKMLSGKDKVLEIGCGDAFGSRIVQQEVSKLVATDFDPIFVQDVISRMDKRWPFVCKTHNFVKKSLPPVFDAAYSIDVLEHIAPEDEPKFIENIVSSLKPNGVMIIGTPSLESQEYASPSSKIGHVNCRNAGDLKYALSKFFHNVFIFSMNDEVIHTGFTKMAHYLFALCCDKRGK